MANSKCTTSFCRLMRSKRRRVGRFHKFIGRTSRSSAPVNIIVSNTFQKSDAALNTEHVMPDMSPLPGGGGGRLT
uniref:Uncharacterized protein n=1 Tax=Rhizophora mucronata TaxID=61149 RepID=A0A2P2MGZ3_RHIMU